MDTPLLQKYDVPAPRYTSYPTVPYWQTGPPDEEVWVKKIQTAFEASPMVSLYIHLPYCERLCTYCGCNKRITRNHQVEEPYIASVLKEWQMYLDVLPGKPMLREIHLGGGTPTFFSPAHLEQLLTGIFDKADVVPEHEFGFEAHPASTSPEHLETLHRLGFRRLSIGVQDFDNDILRIINRLQTCEDVERVTQQARALGYTSLNYDLIFGLPLQTTQHIVTNMEKISQLRPDRLAFYSYAHVPWIKPSQRAYSEADLPTGQEKRALYETGRHLLEATGYREIGLDHFALPTDSLRRAMDDGSLHRNFMGYTPHYTRLSIALGASSISDSWDAFVQNEKEIGPYRQRIAEGHFPISKGHLLTTEDQVLRQHILNLMCRFETSWEPADLQCVALYEGLERLAELQDDGLIEIKPFHLKVTEAGRPFLRNICMALDARYWQKQPQGSLFSQAV
ncbi:MAG: oxygen-independent coproporphyrinogen III oxidase [Bacteroidetes bacterium]|nr:oxygen-independent coproporphyrinogen III oxidase [Bacteroidota bacterium]